MKGVNKICRLLPSSPKVSVGDLLLSISLILFVITTALRTLAGRQTPREGERAWQPSFPLPLSKGVA